MLRAGNWRHTFFVLGVGVAAMLAPLGAAAQSGPDDWEFRATIYGWLPNVKATTNLTTVKVDGDEILDDLQFAAMGTLQARKGRWGAFTDVIYYDLSGSKTGGRQFTVRGGGPVAAPADAILNGNLSMDGWVWTLAGQYTAIQEPNHELNVFAGFRYLSVSTSFNWSFSGNVGPIATPLRAGSESADDHYWDAIAGVHGIYKLGDGRWFLPYYLDVGTGSSEHTWQALAGVGYQFKWGSVVAAYRYLEYEMEEGKVLEDMSMYGPMLGVTFQF